MSQHKVEAQQECIGRLMKGRLIGRATISWQSLSDLQYTTTENETRNVNKLKF